MCTFGIRSAAGRNLVKRGGRHPYARVLKQRALWCLANTQPQIGSLAAHLVLDLIVSADPGQGLSWTPYPGWLEAQEANQSETVDSMCALGPITSAPPQTPKMESPRSLEVCQHSGTRRRKAVLFGTI